MNGCTPRYYSEITFIVRLKNGGVKQNSFTSLRADETAVHKEAALIYGDMLFRVESFWSRTLKNRSEHG